MIHPEAKRMAKELRRMQCANRLGHEYYVQIKANDRRYHWVTMKHEDLRTLSRDEDLQAVCQAMLINRGLIKTDNGGAAGAQPQGATPEASPQSAGLPPPPFSRLR